LINNGRVAAMLLKNGRVAVLLLIAKERPRCGLLAAGADPNLKGSGGKRHG
jgi:hypothetical protein